MNIEKQFTLLSLYYNSKQRIPCIQTESTDITSILLDQHESIDPNKEKLFGEDGRGNKVQVIVYYTDKVDLKDITIKVEDESESQINSIILS